MVSTRRDTRVDFGEIRAVPGDTPAGAETLDLGARVVAGPGIWWSNSLTERGNGTSAADWGRSTAASGRSVMNFDTESIDGYAIPVDPMDLLQCDSCQ